MATPHDALFKLVFRHPEHVAAELRHLLPAAVFEQIEWQTLRLLDGGTVDGELRGHHADLLYAVELRGRKGLLYIVLEHKSGSGGQPALQLLRYATRELEACHADPAQAGRLPYMMAVLVHHDAVPWSGGTDLLHISGVEAEAPPILASCLLNLPFWLDDLSSQSVASLKARDMPALARLALFCLKRARHSGDLIQELRSWIEELRMIPWADELTVTHLGLLRYIMEVTNLSPARLSEFLRTEVGPEAENTMKTTYEKIVEEGMATLLLGLLEKRFGPLSEQVVQQVRAASQEQLEEWAARILTEETLDGVLALD